MFGKVRTKRMLAGATSAGVVALVTLIGADAAIADQKPAPMRKINIMIENAADAMRVEFDISDNLAAQRAMEIQTMDPAKIHGRSTGNHNSGVYHALKDRNGKIDVQITAHCTDIEGMPGQFGDTVTYRNAVNKIQVRDGCKLSR